MIWIITEQKDSVREKEEERERVTVGVTVPHMLSALQRLSSKSLPVAWWDVGSQYRARIISP